MCPSLTAALCYLRGSCKYCSRVPGLLHRSKKSYKWNELCAFVQNALLGKQTNTAQEWIFTPYQHISCRESNSNSPSVLSVQLVRGFSNLAWGVQISANMCENAFQHTIRKKKSSKPRLLVVWHCKQCGIGSGPRYVICAALFARCVCQKTHWHARITRVSKNVWQNLIPWATA